MSEMKKIPVILDGDPGHDDAIAWVLAAAADEFDIKAITTVAGNQTLAKVTYNALRICALLGLNVPVSRGRAVPIMSDLFVAPSFHGESGLDGPKLPEPAFEECKLSSVELMAKVLRESDTPVTIIATGPQTNVAALLVAHPELKEKIGHISIMGGGFRNGNWTAAAEFNIIEDPESAAIEFQAGVPLTVCGLDVTEKAIVTPNDRKKVRAVGNQVSQVVSDWLDFFFKHHKELGWEGSPLHDPCAVLVLTHPDFFEIKDIYAEVETRGRYCRGETVGDFLNITGKKPNVHAVVGVDKEKFVDLIVEACRKFDGWEVHIDE